MGAILWSFANGYDDCPVRKENTHGEIKSIGNSATVPRDLDNDEDAKIVLYVLSESVSARLRENGFRCRTVEISVRDKDLYSFTRQMKLSNVTNITSEISENAFKLFQSNYKWNRPISSNGVRACDLVCDNY